MKNIAMSRKLWGSIVLMWLGMMMVVGWAAFDRKEVLIHERTAGLERLISSAHELIDSYRAQVAAGELTREQAQQRAIRNVGALTFDGSYIYIFDDAIHLVWHPTREAGKDMSSFQDDNGLYFYRELRNVGQAPEGGTFIYNSYDKSSEQDVSRLNYVQRVPEWDWYLATNVYITDINAAFWSGMLKLGGVSLAICLLLTGIMSWIIRGVTTSLGGDPREARTVVQRIASGDLSQPLTLKRKDQSSLLYAIEGMRTRLVDVMGNVRQASRDIDTGTDQLNQGNQDLSARTEQQSASIEETAASMEELTQTVRQNSDNARQASELAGEVSQTARDGGKVMTRVVETMEEITTSSQKVTDIIGLIDSISFQTNILALNASVEAARAGEQGRGFAVVANEVRSLASRSANASQDIRTLLETSHGHVNQGAEAVREARDTISQVIESTERMTSLIHEISVASQEQSEGIEQVNVAVNQMEQVTQQNASLVEEGSSATELLRQQASALESEVAWFTLAEVPEHSKAPAVAPPRRTMPAPQKVSAPANSAPAPAAKPGKVAEPALADEDDWTTF